MHFLFPPGFTNTEIKPPYEHDFLLPYTNARHVEGPFGNFFSQAVVEDQYHIDFQVAFTKEPVTFTIIPDWQSVMLLYIFQGDIVLVHAGGRKQKLEAFACYGAYVPAGHYTVELGEGVHCVVQIQLPRFALYQLTKYLEIFMLWDLFEEGSHSNALLYITEISNKAADTIKNLLHCRLEDEERVLFQLGRMMDLVVLLAEDLAALNKDSAGALKFSPDDIKAVQDALDLQNGYENTPLNLRELARKVNMHPKKLNAGFRLLKGKTSRTLAHEARIEKAKKLLRETRMPVSEIAYETGYCNSSAFIKAFKRSVGISPSVYRK